VPNRTYPRRGAFTLIELLVVIALIMILAGLAAALLPTIGDNARAARAAGDLQQWILTAKQKALRDQVPCGLRLLIYRDPNTIDPLTGLAKVYPYQARQCQFIEQPDDFPSSPGSTISGGGGSGFINFSIPIQIGQVSGLGSDYLELFGSGLMHKITSCNAGTGQLGQINVSPTLGHPLSNPTTQYRIVRSPRVTGDDILQLPDSVIIDLKTNATYGNHLPTPNIDISSQILSYDILFAPTGAMISPGVTTDTLNLWVRDYDPTPNSKATNSPDDADPTQSEQTIIAIYVRTGLTAAHPAAHGTDPYTFIKDGRTSGK